MRRGAVLVGCGSPSHLATAAWLLLFILLIQASAAAWLLLFILLIQASAQVLDLRPVEHPAAPDASAAPLSPQKADRSDVLFQDLFDRELRADWTWVRAVEGAARIVDGVLRVRPSSGTLWESDNTGSNLLLRPAPADVRSYSIEANVLAANGEAKSPGLYEQAGLIWYADDDNYVKLCMEYYEDRWWIVLGAERNGKAEYAQGKFDDNTARLRLTLTEGRAAGAFKAASGDDWREAGAFDLPKPPSAPRVGLFAQTGPAAPDRHVGFDEFAVRRIPG